MPAVRRRKEERGGQGGRGCGFSGSGTLSSSSSIRRGKKQLRGKEEGEGDVKDPSSVVVVGKEGEEDDALSAPPPPHAPPPPPPKATAEG